MKIKALTEGWTQDDLKDLDKCAFKVFKRNTDEISLNYIPSSKYGSGNVYLTLKTGTSSNRNCLATVSFESFGDKFERQQLIPFDKVRDASKINSLCNKLKNQIDSALDNLNNLTAIDLLISNDRLIDTRGNLVDKIDKVLKS